MEHWTESKEFQADRLANLRKRTGLPIKELIQTLNALKKECGFYNENPEQCTAFWCSEVEQKLFSLLKEKNATKTWPN